MSPLKNNGTNYRDYSILFNIERNVYRRYAGAV